MKSNHINRNLDSHNHLPEDLQSFLKNLSPEDEAKLLKIVNAGKDLLGKLQTNENEIHSLLNALEGGYTLPQFGGDVIRDGSAVLPTGRNIHAMDPWRIPSDLAMKRGAHIAEKLIEAHQEENGIYPETIAQVLWGMDTIKTKGEPVAIILGLFGAEPIKDGQGKISSYGLIPIEKLGRPRIDVLMTASGIFRDTFGMQMDFLDRLVQLAASADEPHEMNFIRKHVDEIMAEKRITFEQATARIFTQREGDYGTYVDDQIESSSWQEENELGDMFIKRNSYSYGGKRSGTENTLVLELMMKKVDRISQEIDSVEYGLTDHQHYFAQSGAMSQAVEKRSGKKVSVSYIESYTSETNIQNLDSMIRMEARTKILNPKWYDTMLKNGRSGAAEISSRFTYLLGWSATTKSVDKWVFDESAKTFLFDEEMRNKLEKLNPEALKNMTGRMLEAAGRGLWNASEDDLEKLRELYADLEDKLEGIKVTS
ncbi:MAG: cobaltochelatase subunit CobN [Chloroherpetonaceae bacterium]|nr:cobaltochelatase subunit CobN [Chloroherpetonaceae bacterium]